MGPDEWKIGIMLYLVLIKRINIFDVAHKKKAKKNEKLKPKEVIIEENQPEKGKDKKKGDHDFVNFLMSSKVELTLSIIDNKFI